MGKAIADQGSKSEGENFLAGMGTVHEGARRIIEAGGLSIFRQAIDDPEFRKALAAFASSYRPEALSYDAFLKWLKKNNLEKFLSGRSLEKQLRGQGEFYRQFYGPGFKLDRKKIRINVGRLPAIKAGLEAGCLNYALLKVVPDNLDKIEASMTEALYFYERILALLKKDGLRIWAEVGVDRWIELTLKKLLSCSNPIEPEEFNPEAMREDWVKEIIRVALLKGEAPRVVPGSVELVFTSDLPDIPADQKTVNKAGEIVEPKDRSYISVITNQVRVISRAEGILLAAQLYWQNKTYLARNTWEWLRDVASHPAVNPPVSIGHAHSRGDELELGSSVHWGDGRRFRLSL